EIHDGGGELAVEGTAGARLDDADRVAVVAQEIHARRGREGEVDLLGLAVVVAVPPAPEVLEELGPGELRLAGEEDVAVGPAALRAERGERPADRDQPPALAEQARELRHAPAPAGVAGGPD